MSGVDAVERHDDATEIARLNRLLDWCKPRLPARYRVALDEYRAHPVQADHTPVVASPGLPTRTAWLDRA